jgi:hypothetical protein
MTAALSWAGKIFFWLGEKFFTVAAPAIIATLFSIYVWGVGKDTADKEHDRKFLEHSKRFEQLENRVKEGEDRTQRKFDLILEEIKSVNREIGQVNGELRRIK